MNHLLADKKNSVILILTTIYLLIAVFLMDIFSIVKDFNNYLIILSFIALFFALLFFNMKYALLLLIFMRPISEYFLDISIPLSITNQALNFTSMISILIIFAGFFYLLINKTSVFDHPLSRPLITFVVVTFFSIFVSSDIRLSFEEWLKIASIFFVFMIASQVIKNKEDIKQLVGAILLSIVTPTFVAFYQLFAGIGDTKTKGFLRIYGTFVHPIMLAYYILLVLTIILVLNMESKNRHFKFYSYLSFIPLGIIFLNTYARAAWLMLVLVLLLLGTIRYRQLLMAFPVVLIIVFLFFSSSITLRFDDIIRPEATVQSGASDANTLETREDTWQKNIPLFLANPILGNGIGASYEEIRQAAHNDYLRILTETGIIGLMSYLWLLFAAVKSGWRAFKDSSDTYRNNLSLVFFVMTVVYMILSIESNILINGAFQWTFWTLAAITYNSNLRADEKSSKLPLLKTS